MDDQAQMSEQVKEQLDVGRQSSTAAVTVQMVSHSTLAPARIQAFISTDTEAGISTTFVVSARQDRPRVPSHSQQFRSRSKTPPLPSAMKPAFARYRSRSQTLTQRQASGSLPSAYGQPTGVRRTMRVSSMGLTDGMKSLTLEECEDRMDFTWD